MPGAWLTSRVDYPALEQVFLHDLVDVVDLDVLVEDAVGVDQDDRADRAGPQAAGLDDPRLRGDAHVLQFLGECGAYLERSRGDAAAPGAHEHVIAYLIHILSHSPTPT